MVVHTPVSPLEKAWEFQPDSSIGELGLVAASDMIFFGSKDGRIYAIDAMSGVARWTFKMGKELMLSLVTADGIIFAASKDKNLYAIDVQTGKEKWRFSAGGEISPPAVSYGAVFFGSKDKRVYGLDVNSGEKLWEAKTGHKKHSCPIIADGKVLIAGDDDLYALDPNNGTILWEVKKALFYQTLPAVAGGLAFCTKDSAVIDLASGKEVEKIPSLRGLRDLSQVVLADGTLYTMALAGTTDPLTHIAEFLFAHDLATRKEKWHACFNTLKPRYEVGEGFVFIAADDKLMTINISKFTKRWESDKLLGETISKPVIAYGMVFISCSKAVYAFRSSKDPTSQRSLEISDEISPSPKYEAETLRHDSNIIWPNCCCLCCGPAEDYVDLNVVFQPKGLRLGVEAKGIPYCKECHKKITKSIITGREKPGVEIIRFPPTYAFRNEKYWAMFMEANRLR